MDTQESRPDGGNGSKRARMTEMEALRERRSIRKYVDRPLEKSDVEALQAEIERLNRESGLRMQLVTDEPRAFKTMLAYGSFRNVKNYVMVVGRKSASAEYRAGYYCESLVLFAQSIGLNTCIVGLTYKKVPGRFEVGHDEKVMVCIAVGYGDEEGRNHRIKSPEQVSNIGPSTPQWFARGVDAALKSPTAVNQQKFHFEYVAPTHPGEKAGVRPGKGSSLVGYTRIDLGIAMRNFETGAGKDNFNWIDNPLD